MDNSSYKAEKLAAARKKLKEFQNLQKHKEDVKSNIPIEQNNVRSAGSFVPLTQVAIIETQFSNNFSNPAQPSLANYFPNSDKHGFFFETTQKHSNGVINQPTFSDSTPYFSSNLGGTYLPTNCAPSLPIPVENIKITESSINGDTERLKEELLQAEEKIKMQTEALDIVTSEREDLRKKLKNISDEVVVYQERIQSFQNELEKSLSKQTELNVTVNELKRFTEDLSARELVLQQNINDLKEKNDELMNSLEINKEKNMRLQCEFEKSESNYNMLSLKFKQLGIEVKNNGKYYRSVDEDWEEWKKKCVQLEEQLKTMIFEKEHTNDEYRQYVDRLKQELQNTETELQRVFSENEALARRNTSQTEHISNLEKQLQKSSTQMDNEATVNELRAQFDLLKRDKENDKRTIEKFQKQMIEYEQSILRASELERELENLNAEMTNAAEWQSTVESSKVAASQAISQNNKLKSDLEQLHQMVEILNGEKAMLAQMLEEEKAENKKLDIIQQELRRNSNQEIQTNDAAINTDVGDVNDNGVYGEANVEAMLQLQDKFKSVLDRMADLTDEKQQLEHLVLQLQCETETIGEYVALYQKQRSVLHERARETDHKMERVIKEKQCLLSILRSILNTDPFDSSFVRQLIEDNLSVKLSDELSQNSSLSSSERQNIRSFALMSVSDHHPSCPCCSGKLITL